MMFELLLGTLVGVPRFKLCTPISEDGSHYEYRWIDKVWKYAIGNWFLWLALPMTLFGEMEQVFPSKEALLGSGCMSLLVVMVIAYSLIYVLTSLLEQNLGARIACFKNSATVPILLMSWFLPDSLRAQMIKALVLDQVATAIIAIALCVFMSEKEKEKGIGNYLSLIINPFVVTTAVFAALLQGDGLGIIRDYSEVIHCFKMQYKFLGVANFVHEAGYYHNSGGLRLRKYAKDIALCMYVKFTAAMIVMSVGPMILDSYDQALAFAIYLVAAVSSSFLRIVKGLADDESVRCYIAVSIATHPLSFAMMGLVYWLDILNKNL